MWSYAGHMIFRRRGPRPSSNGRVLGSDPARALLGRTSGTSSQGCVLKGNRLEMWHHLERRARPIRGAPGAYRALRNARRMFHEEAESVGARQPYGCVEMHDCLGAPPCLGSEVESGAGKTLLTCQKARALVASRRHDTGYSQA